MLAVSSVLLSACVTDPYSGQSRMSKTAMGTGIGAAVGAGAGTLFGGNDWKNAGLGALAGGAVGAAVGLYMDNQEQEMRESLRAIDTPGDECIGFRCQCFESVSRIQHYRHRTYRRYRQRKL